MSIVPIRPGLEPEPPAGEVMPSVVAALEELLDRARAGELVGIAYAAQYLGKMTNYHHCGYRTRAVIGALVLLQHDMCRSDIEEDE